MDFLTNLIPDSFVARGTLIFLAFLFTLWLIFFAAWIIKIRRIKKSIRAGLNVGELTAELNNKTTNLTANPNQIFARYCEDKGIKDESIIRNHIRSIFDAGWQGSRLEVGELLKNTNGQIVKELIFLRSIQALYIIVGLLGTLFGLAESIAHLSGMNLKDLVLTEEQSSTGIAQFLEPLKSAFSPSIAGIALTIFCTVVITSYLYLVVQSVKNELDQATLNIWVPGLFPPTSRRFLQGLTLTQEYMELSENATRLLSEHSKNIQEGALAFMENLEAANTPLKAIIKSVAKVNQFTEKFSDAVELMTLFQNDLRQLYGAQLVESREFHREVGNTIKDLHVSHNEFLHDIKRQGANLDSIYRTIKLFDHEYLKERESLDINLREVLQEAKKAYGASLEKDNYAEILKQDLVDELKTTSKTIEGAVAVLSAKIEQQSATSSKTFSDAVARSVEKMDATLRDLAGVLIAGNQTHSQNAEYQKRLLEVLESIDAGLKKYESVVSPAVPDAAGLAPVTAMPQNSDSAATQPPVTVAPVSAFVRDQSPTLLDKEELENLLAELNSDDQPDALWRKDSPPKDER